MMPESNTSSKSTIVSDSANLINHSHNHEFNQFNTEWISSGKTKFGIQFERFFFYRKLNFLA